MSIYCEATFIERCKNILYLFRIGFLIIDAKLCIDLDFDRLLHGFIYLSRSLSWTCWLSCNGFTSILWGDFITYLNKAVSFLKRLPNPLTGSCLAMIYSMSLDSFSGSDASLYSSSLKMTSFTFFSSYVLSKLSKQAGPALVLCSAALLLFRI